MNPSESRDLVNFLFDKLLTHTDTDLLDLGEDDSCCDHLNWEELGIDPPETEQLSLFPLPFL